MVYKNPTQVKDDHKEVGDTLWLIDCSKMSYPIQVKIESFYKLYPNSSMLLDTSCAVETWNLDHTIRHCYTFYNCHYVIVADNLKECMGAALLHFLDILESNRVEERELSEKLENCKKHTEDVKHLMCKGSDTRRLLGDYEIWHYEMCKNRIAEGYYE